MLRMTDHLALTRDGIQFNTQQGRRWINDVFQTQIGEMEQELRTNNSLAQTSSTGGVRVRGNVPESLANRLRPLAMETGATDPVALSSDKTTVGEPLEDNRWRADLGDQLIRVRLALRPYRRRVTRPPR